MPMNAGRKGIYGEKKESKGVHRKTKMITVKKTQILTPKNRLICRTEIKEDGQRLG